MRLRQRIVRRYDNGLYVMRQRIVRRYDNGLYVMNTFTLHMLSYSMFLCEKKK
ncbi:MAG: hypothetical protein AB8G77_12320 [Rhodothermales bacterium]